MMVRYTLRAAALASTCLLPLVAFAQEVPDYDNQIEAGAQYQSQSSFRFGRFTGQTDNGGTAIGGVLIRGREAWDSGGTRYWELQGNDLGFQSRSMSGKYGQQGTWGAQIFYDGVPYFDTNSFHTIYDTSGTGSTVAHPAVTANNTLNQTGATAANNNAWTNANQLAPYLSVQGLSTQRDIVGGKFNYEVGPYWSLDGGLTHEHKEGTRDNSLMFGGGTHLNTYRQCNPAGATAGNNVAPGVCTNVAGTSLADSFAFPQPINFDTDRYDATASFTAPRLQGQFGYSYLSFNDNNTAFNAIFPFPYAGPAASGNWLPGGTVQAAYAQPPSSSEHQVRASLGYDVLPSTRINANASYGLALQDASMPPISNNNPLSFGPANAAALIAGNPGQLDGKQQNIFGNLAIASRPLHDLELKASYTYDDRHDLTPLNTFYYYARDATAGTGSPTAAQNEPQSFRDQTAKAEAAYHFLPHSKLTLNYEFVQKDAKQGLYETLRENTFGAKINSRLFNGVDGMVGYAHSNRYTASDYLDGISPAQYSAFGGQAYGTVPFFEAPRVRDEGKAKISYVPDSLFTAALNAKVASDHYNISANPQPANVLITQGSGLRNDLNLMVGPDVTYVPNKALSTHLFYNYQKIFRDSGLVDAIPTVNSTTANNLGSSPYFKNSLSDDVHTVGVAGDWQAAPKLKFSASYNFSYGDTAFNISDGASLAYLTSNTATVNSNAPLYSIIPLPDVTSQLHSFQVRGEYQFQPNMSLWVGYQFERFIYKDFAYTIPVTGFDYGNALNEGTLNPSYTVHVIGAAVRVKW